MPRAVLRDGVIYPLDPLPPDWANGLELVVQPATEMEDGPAGMEQWARDMDALCADSDPEDEARLLAAIEDQRREAKAQARHEMGLPE
jgi:hypothetical protein